MSRYVYLCDGLKKECRDKPSCAINCPETGHCDHTAELRHAKNAMRILNGEAEYKIADVREYEDEDHKKSKKEKVYWEVDYLQ